MCDKKYAFKSENRFFSECKSFFILNKKERLQIDIKKKEITHNLIAQREPWFIIND